MKLIFLNVVLAFFLVSCASNNAAVEHSPNQFGSPVPVAPDYYYQTNPTYPSPRHLDYERDYVHPYEPENSYRGDENYYVPYYYQQQNFNNNNAKLKRSLKLQQREGRKEIEEEMHNTFLDESH